MRRMVVMVVVALMMLAVVMAMAMPAFAAASPKANCLGEAFSNEPPGTKGQQVSEAAKDDGLGAEFRMGTKIPREATCVL